MWLRYFFHSLLIVGIVLVICTATGCNRGTNPDLQAYMDSTYVTCGDSTVAFTNIEEAEEKGVTVHSLADDKYTVFECCNQITVRANHGGFDGYALMQKDSSKSGWEPVDKSPEGRSFTSIQKKQE